jgi:ATP/maltotriose-dependent transcriptional regulator MalT
LVNAVMGTMKKKFIKNFVEPLTHRELDVPDLLAQRLSNQEIADKLYISLTTVKSHLKNIYGNLSVNKRREAVEKAMKIGIL